MTCVRLPSLYVKASGFDSEKNHVSYTRFRSVYVPKLRKHGLRNDRDGEGSYLEE